MKVECSSDGLVKQDGVVVGLEVCVVDSNGSVGLGDGTISTTLPFRVHFPIITATVKQSSLKLVYAATSIKTALASAEQREGRLKAAANDSTAWQVQEFSESKQSSG